MKTILVTGATSIIGTRIAEMLLETHRVLLLVHKRRPTRSLASCPVIEGGLADLGKHRDVIRSADLVLHMAGLTHSGCEADYYKVNRDGTQMLLDACRPEQQIVYLSTRCVGEEGGGYSASKLAAEKAIRKSGLHHVVIRPAEVYGSAAGEGIDQLIALARRFRCLIDFQYRPTVTYSPVSVDELAAFMLAVLQNPPRGNRIYTISNRREYTAREIYQALRQSGVWPLLRLPVPVKALQLGLKCHLPLPFCPDQLKRLVMAKSCDISTAASDYGFNPTCYLEHLRRPHMG